MRTPRTLRRGWPAAAGTVLLVGASAWGAGPPASVVTTVHNLSVSGPGEVRSLTETEVCKFCHIPHNALEPEPLWGHALSKVPSYAVPPLRSRGGAAAPQPDGASRLCLSCHDGTVALGEIAGQARPIEMAGAQRLTPGRPGFLGTDLSGSHPISFVISDAGTQDPVPGEDIGLKSAGVIRSDPKVRLDAENKMQCTTCHDAHADRYFQEDRVPRFWVAPTVSEVCLSCHALR